MLADDAFGLLVAHRVEQLHPPGVEVVYTSESGFHLLDYVQNVTHLIAVDTIQTGRADPGALYILREGDVQSAPGGSPHFIGLFETLALGRKLGLSVPDHVTILAVEPADCLTVGGPIHPAVEAAIPRVVRLVREIVQHPSGRDL
jgi:hydrogenase maturation protease